MRQWNKETINEQLKLHKKQNKDERYNYFSREFNSLWYCWELEKYTISLQNQLQQKENIIKEVRENIKEDNKYLESAKEMYINQNNEILKTHTLQLINNSLVQNDKLLKILDKGKNNEEDK